MPRVYPVELNIIRYFENKRKFHVYFTCTRKQLIAILREEDIDMIPKQLGQVVKVDSRIENSE